MTKNLRGTKDNIAALYDRMTSVPEFLATSEVSREKIAAFFDSLPKGTSILDVGPGKGEEAKLAIDKGHHVTGVDISPKMLDVFKQSVPEATSVAGDARNLPFASDSFDAVFAASCILHLDRSDGITAIKEFYRVLKTGGWLFLATTCGDGDEELNERPWLQEAGIECWYFYHWQRSDLATQVEDAGLSITACSEEVVIEGRPPFLFMTAQKSDLI